MIKKCSLFVFLLFTAQSTLAQTNIDTLSAELDKLVVVGYQGNRSILETPGSISFIRAERISGLDNSSLLYGLNTIPGVRMEERAPGSYRISIRGSSLRSPFGIRNVKIYWNGIPLTEPTGSTFLNLLDVTNMQQVEVIKGPSGSVYGAGNGGTLLMQSNAPILNTELTSGLTIGSFETIRYDLGYHEKLEKGSISFKYAENHSDGHREQSFLDRRVAEISGKVEYMEGRELSANVLYSDLNYGIPGGLNLTQFETDPSQARPGNPFVLGSVDANASIKQESLLFGLMHTYQITDKLSNEASAFGSFSDFENPFNFDYKIDSRKSGGFRSVYMYDTQISDQPAKFVAGTEMHSSSYASRNFQNNAGQSDSLNFDDELKVQSMLIFASIQVDLANDWYLTSGISFNSLKYDINRLVSFEDDGITGEFKRDFDPQFVPRIGLAKKLGNSLTAHASISAGFSPPTIDEVRTNEGSINLDLEAERGLNYELGLRGNAFEGKLGFDAVVFFLQLKESIIQQQSERGTVLFRNAGSTNQNGFELSANYLLADNYSGFLRRAQLSTSYTFHNFEFDEYNTSDGDFSGNELTGVAPHVLFASLDVATGPGFYGNLSYNFTDEIPLEDDNSLYTDAYQLVQSKIGWKTEFTEKIFVDAYFGIDNLLDERYSRGFDINAFGGRYYQPAPERNWFAGFRLKYKL